MKCKYIEENVFLNNLSGVVKIKEDKKKGLSPKQLSEIIKISEDLLYGPDEIDDTQRKSEMLCDLIAQPFSSRLRKCDSLTSTVSHIPQLIDTLSDKTIKELLLDPKTSISDIRQIKDFSKELSSTSRGKMEHDVANVLYYAAIAHALVYHEEKITSFSDEELQKAFLKLKREKWVIKSLVELFQKATF